MIDLFVVMLIVLFVLRLALEAIAWAQRWHRGIRQLQEQARLRAEAAHQQQIEEHRRALRRYDSRALDYPCNR